ncbi:chemotaxis protein CheB [Amycolatopsis sp. NPDC051071]|uniref:chemotaxis protein CheB n=1 Tax=Amycolatopsis sp. NPDC051071 TaxID=3154637 RepID=UPI0034283483
MRCHRDVVVVGASAGGVEALRALARSLPPDFPAAVLVVMHLAPGLSSALPRILARAGPLDAVSAEHGAPLTAGTLHVAPPDHHLLIEDGAVLLSRGPTESGHRPAIDATFRSAALSVGPRAIGVVLSGVLDDGAAGLRSIADRGGLAVVQDPADALYPGMPENALARVPTEHVHPVDMLGKVLDKLVRTPVDNLPIPPASSALLLEERIARDGVRLGAVTVGGSTPPAGYRCPDCQGSLLEVGPADGRYRCRIGHGWTDEALFSAQDAELERALWTALRSLDERVSLAERMLRRATTGGMTRRYENAVRESSAAAETLRKFLLALDKETRPGQETPREP